jgi:hypothetical protein
LVNRPEAENCAGSKVGSLTSSTSLDFIILDERGYVPFVQNRGQLLFHTISIRPSTRPSAERTRGIN